MNKDLMKGLGFGKEVERIERGECPLCGETINTSKFKDDLSRREYEISGMCQECQDETF
jgi:hypothetical protein